METKPFGDGNGYIVIPKWFVSFLSFLVSVVFVGAVLWAWSISNDVSAIKAEVRTQNELRTSELEDVRRRSIGTTACSIAFSNRGNPDEGCCQ